MPMCKTALDSVLHVRQPPKLQGWAETLLRLHLAETRPLQGTAAHVPAHNVALAKHCMGCWQWAVCCAKLSHNACSSMSQCATGCCSACRVKAAHVPTRNRALDDVLNREEARMPGEDLVVRRVRWQQWQAKEKTITQGMERALNLQQSLGGPAGECG